MPQDKIKSYDVRTNAEWQSLGFTAENRPTVTVTVSDVPESFRHLIPFVERWAIGCDVIRGDYFSKQPQVDVDAFYQAVLPHLDALNAWVDTLPCSDAKIQFLTMLKADCEATPPPPPEQIAATHRRWAAEREAKRKHWKDVMNAQRNQTPNHALQRTRRGRRGCNRCLRCAGSLSLSR
jgi:hypothetical protein